MERKDILRKMKELQQEYDALSQEYEKSLSHLSRMDFCVAVIQENELPHELYNSWGSDEHDTSYYHPDDVTVGVVWGYRYTDIVGLTDEEFKTVKELIESIN